MFSSIRSRIHAILLGFAVAAALLPMNTLAQTEVKVSAEKPAAAPPIIVTAPTTTSITPNTFTLNFSASDMTGDNITSFQFDIIFDPNVIVPSGANFGCSSAGTITPASWFILCNVTPSNRLRVNASDFFNTPLTGSGTILKVTFQTAPTAAVGNISPLQFFPTSLRMFTTTLNEIPSTPVDGQVTLISGTTAADVAVSGRVVNQGGSPISKARLFLRDSHGNTWIVLTNPFGYYQFQDIPAGETYVLAADAKRYTFQQRVITVGDAITDLDLVSDQ